MSWGRKKNGSGKYGGGKVEVCGHWFDSKLEAAVYKELALMQKAGEISHLVHHPGTVFLSEARIQYRPDFSFWHVANNRLEYAEAKGFANDKWPLKKKLWKFYGPGVLHIYQGSHKSFRKTETIIPKTKE